MEINIFPGHWSGNGIFQTVGIVRLLGAIDDLSFEIRVKYFSEFSDTAVESSL